MVDHSTQRKLVIWGASGHALVVADIIRLTGEYDIVGFIDDVSPVREDDSFCGFPLLGCRDCLKKLARDRVSHLIFGLGNCEARLRLAE
jgi:UDP-N-acetylbacillosamine N-acetyltransferase